MSFTFKKNKSQKRKKIKKKINEIKFNINNEGIIKGKSITKIFKVESLVEIKEIINEAATNMNLKLLINYNMDEFYIFKTEDMKKNKKSNNNKSISQTESNGLEIEQITSLLKSFYSEEEMEWDNSFLKKTKKLKYEMAPTVFEVKDNYLLSENRYINVISLEHLGSYLNIKDIIMNNNCWLAIDCYKVDRDFILNKLDEMKRDNMIEKKFSSFISNNIKNIINKLNGETIFQCELKLLLYNSSLEQIREECLLIKDNLILNKYTSYIPQERLNTRKLFEKCIYPNMNMDIIHSITSRDLYKLIGGND